MPKTKTIKVSFQVLSDFLHSLQEKSLENWYNANQEMLNNVHQALKLIKVPRSDRRKEQTCRFICEFFPELFRTLYYVEKKQFNSEDLVDQFLLHLLASYETNNWSLFYDHHEHYFDSVIHLAREQKLLDIKVEGVNGKIYPSFHEAELIRSHFENVTMIRNEIGIACIENKVHSGDKPRNTEFKLLFCCGNESKKENENSKSGSMKEVITDQPPQKKNQPIIQMRNKTIEILDLKNTTLLPEVKEVGSKQDKVELLEQIEQQLKEIVSMEDIHTGNAISEQSTKKSCINERPGVHRTSNASNDSFSFVRNATDSSFQRKLNAQNKKFAEEMESIRERRERLNREAEEEMSKFRRESAMRIQMFLNCIQLKLRWEEQENEWSDWLKCAREPVIKVKTKFLDFDRIRRFDDENEIKSEVTYFHKYVQNAYDCLVHNFGDLAMLSDKYEDKLFLKVIQKCISKVSNKLCALMEHLEEFQDNEQFYSKTNKLESDIDSMDIPTTSKLRLVCESTTEEYHKFISPPKQPQSYCIISEI